MSRAAGTAPPGAHASGDWVGLGSRSVVPPADYWAYLTRMLPGSPVEELQRLSDQRLGEISAADLRPPPAVAVELLDRVAADGWFERRLRQKCPNCDFHLTEIEAAQAACPECEEAFSQHGGVSTETVWVRELAPSRDVDWVVAIHGMNTRGAWQEALNWLLATTWGRSVPVAVYKYGIVIAGVLMAWRRGKLRNELRDKLAALRDQARAQGFSGDPDVIAHSFGTWLLGHLIELELTRRPEDRLRFGRIILTGCVLRPDFDWKRLQDAGLVAEVLNHYGTKDRVVPLAHVAIADSGPSGRRGFDGDQVLNVRAAGYGHSDLFSIDKCVVDGQPFQTCTGASTGTTHLENAYLRAWRPFLTLPGGELSGLAGRADPSRPWRQLPWPFRGTLLPWALLPLLAAVITLVVAGLGEVVWEARTVLATVAAASGAVLGSLLFAIGIAGIWRRLRG